MGLFPANSVPKTGRVHFPIFSKQEMKVRNFATPVSFFIPALKIDSFRTYPAGDFPHKAGHTLSSMSMSKVLSRQPRLKKKRSIKSAIALRQLLSHNPCPREKFPRHWHDQTATWVYLPTSTPSLFLSLDVLIKRVNKFHVNNRNTVVTIDRTFYNS